MPGRSIPISVRITPEDAEFIAAMDIAGASTPSDKVRAVLGEARRRRLDPRDYAGCLAQLQEMLAPALRGLRQAERDLGAHSELLTLVGEWLPEMMASLIAGAAEIEPGDAIESLREVESDVADRVFRLIESVLRLGVTETCRGYDAAVIDSRLEAALRLAEVARARR